MSTDVSKPATGITVGEGVTVSGKDAQLASPSHITGKVTGADGVRACRT